MKSSNPLKIGREVSAEVEFAEKPNEVVPLAQVQQMTAEGVSYGVFTDAEDGLVPAPNSYTISAGFPGEGDTLTAGEIVTLTSVVTGGNRFLREDGEWAEFEGSITNITQIANRSYNDLQDLPNVSGRTFKDVSSPYALIVTDKDKYLHVDGINPVLTFDASLFSMAEYVEGVNNSSDPLTITQNQYDASTASGLTNKVKPGGYFRIIRDQYDPGFTLTGDLVEEYSIRQSPNGNLWKVSVDNSGNEVITAL